MASKSRQIAFLSDFGLGNEWVGICHAVLARAAPESRVIDLSHGVPPLDVRVGALVLADSRRFLAEDAIVFAVVDPSVGADRDVAIETVSGRLLVGPDNGLFSFFWRGEGGVTRAHEVTLDSIVIQPVAPSFHARDVLAPAAAFLATGGSIEALGAAVEPTTLAELLFPSASVELGKIECEVLDLNRFGNVLLNVTARDFEDAGFDGAPEVAIDATSGGAYARRVSTYADVAAGDWGLIVDPRGWLAVIRGNPANAAEGLGGVQPGDPIWLTLPRETARSAA